MEERYWDRYWRRRLSRRHVIAGGATLAAGSAAILAGCGDDDDDDGGDATPKPGEPTKAAESPTAAAGKKGGTLRLSKAAPDTGLDPHIVVTNPIHPAKAYSHMWTYRPSTKEILFDLATKYEQADPTTLVITLREGVKFQADVAGGRALTADDVAYSFNRLPSMLAKGSQVNGIQWSWMEKAEAVDAKTVRIKQKNPFASNLLALGSSALCVVAREVVEASGGDLQKVMNAGSGPYKMTKREPTGTRYERNPAYYTHENPSATYVKDGPYIDVWEESIIADAATVKAKFIAGELDILNTAQVTVDKLVADELAKSSGVKVAKGPANAHLIMQFDNFKWTDKRLRQAVWMAFDRDQFIKNIYLGDGLYGGPVADGFAKDGLALSQDELKKAQKFDAAEAKKLWDAAGGPQTFPSIKMITQQAIPLFATATQFIAEALRKNLGVDVKVEVVDPATYVAKAVGGYAEKKPKEWDLFVAWEQSLQSMPDYNALVHYIPTGYGAIFGNLRPDSPKQETAALATQMLQLWNAQAQELNVEARKQKMATLQKTILESYGPAVPLPVTATSYAPYRDRVKNFPVNDFMFGNSGTGYFRVHDLFLDG